MLDKSVAITFINALLEIASKKGQFEQIEKDLDLVCDVITKHDNFKKVLFHPSIPRSGKKDLITSVFGKSISDLMINFLCLLVDRRKEKILEFIPDVYRAVADKQKDVVKIMVQTVVPLTGDRLDNFRKRLKKITGKTVELEVVQNPNCCHCGQHRFCVFLH